MSAYELGRRAVACAHWRWMPGMLLFPHVEDCECCEDRNFPRRAARLPAVFTTDLDVPDFSDPATLGCLLHLVRKAWGETTVYVEHDKCRRRPWVAVLPMLVIDCDTEVEALVAALEAA